MGKSDSSFVFVSARSGPLESFVGLLEILFKSVPPGSKAKSGVGICAAGFYQPLKCPSFLSGKKHESMIIISCFTPRKENSTIYFHLPVIFKGVIRQIISTNTNNNMSMVNKKISKCFPSSPTLSLLSYILT